MSRLVSLLIVLLAIAVATPVLAEERLSLSGYMRVRGWHLDNDTAVNQTYGDQRLRLIGKVSVAEGVAVHFRYGTAFNSDLGNGNSQESNSMNFDRAFIQLDKGMFSLLAGRQFVGLGTLAVDTRNDGFTLNMKGQVPVRAFVLFTDNTKAANKGDGYLYGLNVGHKTDGYSANVFAASQKGVTPGQEVYLVGTNFGTNFDAIKLFAEVNAFFGDHNATVDAAGLQGYVDVSASAAENVTVGGQFYYARGYTDKQQYTHLTGGKQDSGWDPLRDVGAGLHNEQMFAARPYVYLGANAGIIAGRLYGNMKATNDLSVGASAFYGVPEEKKAINEAYKAAYGADLGLSYNLMPRTVLAVQVGYNVQTKDKAANDKEQFGAGTRLQVSF